MNVFIDDKLRAHLMWIVFDFLERRKLDKNAIYNMATEGGEPLDELVSFLSLDSEPPVKNEQGCLSEFGLSAIAALLPPVTASDACAPPAEPSASARQQPLRVRGLGIPDTTSDACVSPAPPSASARQQAAPHAGARRPVTASDARAPPPHRVLRRDSSRSACGGWAAGHCL